MFNLYRFRCIKRFSKQEINIMLFASIYIFFQNKKLLSIFFSCFQKGFPYIRKIMNIHTLMQVINLNFFRNFKIFSYLCK